MTDRTTPTAFADVQGHCPACGKSALFLGANGYVTCSRRECPAPDAASTLLELENEPARLEADVIREAADWLRAEYPGPDADRHFRRAADALNRHAETKG